MFAPLRKKILSLYRKSGKAATAIEYSLVAAGIALAIIVVVFLVGDELMEIYQEIADSFST